jgi:hypothetical protein
MVGSAVGKAVTDRFSGVWALEDSKIPCETEPKAIR